MASIINASTSSGLVETADTSGQLELQSNGATKVSVSSTGVALTGASMTSFAGGVITQGTAVASTSGTSIDFTSIPSWVKRITVMLNGVSTNGSSALQIQLGTGATPTYTTSGYNSNGIGFGGAGTATTNYTAGFGLEDSGLASYTRWGSFILTANGNNWTINGIQFRASSQLSSSAAGGVTLGAALTAVRITTVGGTDTFDAGSINIMYEG